MEEDGGGEKGGGEGGGTIGLLFWIFVLWAEQVIRASGRHLVYL